jgi:hypothetical protein
MNRVSLHDIEAAIPEEGFFKNKEWLLSPEPFALPAQTVAQLQGLGESLCAFLRASESLYFASREETAPVWVSTLLDKGKPEDVVALGALPSSRGDFARVIRPDLLLTDHGLKLSEIDSTPGGIGLTGWLNEFYGNAGWNVLGGTRGMIEGFRALLGHGRILFSEESAGYQPEMEWLVSRFNPAWKNDQTVLTDGEFDEARHGSGLLYRFFEIWDLPNISRAGIFRKLAERGKVVFTAPMKAFMEEKLWLALLWMPGLQAEWTDRLGADLFSQMRALVPQGWVLDPEPLPYHAVYPGLRIQSWDELMDFSQRERRLVLKVSGFSEKAWGSRGVTMGHDVSATAWRKIVQEALADFERSPRILQRFESPSIVRHPYYDRKSGEIRTMEGRVRLCPYYFRTGSALRLGGVLATICPKEKKIIHGMRDAILVPCIAAA